MYQEMFIYRVPESRVEDFERVVGQAIAAFQRHGAIGGSLSRLTDGAAKYGCAGAETAICAQEQGVLYIELSYFHDRAHYDQVTALADDDPEVANLFDVLVKAVDIQHVVRGEFCTTVREVNSVEMAKYASVG